MGAVSSFRWSGEKPAYVLHYSGKGVKAPLRMTVGRRGTDARRRFCKRASLRRGAGRKKFTVCIYGICCIFMKAVLYYTSLSGGAVF